jgi:hypothetical protein
MLDLEWLLLEKRTPSFILRAMHVDIKTRGTASSGMWVAQRTVQDVQSGVDHEGRRVD